MTVFGLLHGRVYGIKLIPPNDRRSYSARGAHIISNVHVWHAEHAEGEMHVNREIRRIKYASQSVQFTV